MKVELEAKFLDVDVHKLHRKLAEIGATCVHVERLMKRVVFESQYLNDKRAWLRIRDEGEKRTMTLKQASDATDITRIKELEVEVTDFDGMHAMLAALGLEEKRYQENRRESWLYQGTAIEIDTWPSIPTYVEIEGKSEEHIKDTAVTLGLNYTEAVFGSVDEVYSQFYNIDILNKERLVFD